jgi:hypothetical protein
MKFVMVNGRTPRQPSFCARCRRSIGESYLREIATQLFYCSHGCYVDHQVPVPAFQNLARAS